MSYNNKPNPDDRSDNVEKLQEMIANTDDNIRKAEATHGQFKWRRTCTS